MSKWQFDRTWASEVQKGVLIHCNIHRVCVHARKGKLFSHTIKTWFDQTLACIMVKVDVLWILVNSVSEYILFFSFKFSLWAVTHQLFNGVSKCALMLPWFLWLKFEHVSSLCCWLYANCFTSFQWMSSLLIPSLDHVLNQMRRNPKGEGILFHYRLVRIG